MLNTRTVNFNSGPWGNKIFVRLTSLIGLITKYFNDFHKLNSQNKISFRAFAKYNLVYHNFITKYGPRKTVWQENLIFICFRISDRNWSIYYIFLITVEVSSKVAVCVRPVLTQLGVRYQTRRTNFTPKRFWTSLKTWIKPVVVSAPLYRE